MNKSVKRKKRVLVAMSGGVDSSVCAAILKEQGYEVIGMTFKLWSGLDNKPYERACCSIDSVEDARRVSQILEIPHYVVNYKKYFEKTVIADFVSEYSKGRTPNPCVRCNEFIKFDSFLKKAVALEADYVATGHYARITNHGNYELLRAHDATKDQSYVLYVMNQHQLAHSLLPLGDLDKTDTRQKARELGLPVAEKKDSQEICFVGDGKYSNFLSRYGISYKDSGPILNGNGDSIGTHEGIVNYTIGQRKGLHLKNSAEDRLYVTSINAENSSITVGTKEQLNISSAKISRVNWIQDHIPKKAVRALVQTRYRGDEAFATITTFGENEAIIHFEKPQSAVAPGQAAVFYDGDYVLGGGTINQTN